MPFLNINGNKVYYEVHGRGEPIILLHHGFGCMKIWKDIYPVLADRDYQLIMYDRRGYGQSEGGPDFFDFFTSDRYRPESVDELARIREFLGLESFHIVGQCEGGVVGLDYAVRYPDQVKTLSISSTLCYTETPMIELNRQAFPQTFQDLDPALKLKMIYWHGQDRAESFFNQCCQYGGAYGRGVFDLRGLLPAVACPVLIIYPDRSALFPVEQGVAFYRGLPKGELAVLPRCGHNTYEHQPEEYTRHILNFLHRFKFGVPTGLEKATCAQSLSS